MLNVFRIRLPVYLPTDRQTLSISPHRQCTFTFVALKLVLFLPQFVSFAEYYFSSPRSIYVKRNTFPEPDKRKYRMAKSGGAYLSLSLSPQLLTNIYFLPTYNITNNRPKINRHPHFASESSPSPLSAFYNSVYIVFHWPESHNTWEEKDKPRYRYPNVPWSLLGGQTDSLCAVIDWKMGIVRWVTLPLPSRTNNRNYTTHWDRGLNTEWWWWWVGKLGACLLAAGRWWLRHRGG